MIRNFFFGPILIRRRIWRSYSDSVVTRVQYIHNLYRENNHHAAPGFSGWSGHAQPQILAAIDHVLKHVIDSVLVHAGSVSDYLSYVPANLSQKAGGTLSRLVARIVREDATEISIVNGWILKIVTLALVL